MNKKVALVSCYFKDNYGSLLQTYALQAALKNDGIDCVNIDIENINKDISAKKKKYYISQLFNSTLIKQKWGMVFLKIRVKLNNTLRSNIAKRSRKHNQFRADYFIMSQPYANLHSLAENNDGFTDFIVGSDQLWLPVNIVGDYYTLNFVPDDVNKISYSTSFGVSFIPNKYKSRYIKFLTRINYLSVREKTGQKIVNDLVGRDAELVCDPTLLLTNEQWLDIAAKPSLKIDGEYIFCYFLGKNIAHRKFAERLKASTGCKIVSLNHCDEYVKYSDKFADYTPYDIGPREFIYLIRHAKYVLTDSFHGTVFSLLMNTPFFSFRRFKANKVSTNSRLDTLLEIVGLQDRILSGEEAVNEVIIKTIDFDNVNLILKNYRKSSHNFLLKALGIE